MRSKGSERRLELTAAMASLTVTGQFTCPVDPEKPLRTLSDDEMRTLRKISGGLASSQ